MLNNFIAENDVMTAKNLIHSQFIDKITNVIGLTIGRQLKEYILKYGFLIYESVEFFGVNSIQLMDSDLVTQTLYLHKYFSKTKDFIAIGDYGDGLYVLVDSQDNVFEFDSEAERLTCLNKSLFDYILSRFKEEKSF